MPPTTFLHKGPHQTFARLRTFGILIKPRTHLFDPRALEHLVPINLAQYFQVLVPCVLSLGIM